MSDKSLEDLVEEGQRLALRAYIASPLNRRGLTWERPICNVKGLVTHSDLIIVEAKEDGHSSFVSLAVIEKGAVVFSWDNGMDMVSSADPENRPLPSSIPALVTKLGRYVVLGFLRADAPPILINEKRSFTKVQEQIKEAVECFLRMRNEGFQEVRKVHQERDPDPLPENLQCISAQGSSDYYLTAPGHWGEDWGDRTFFVEYYS